MVKSEQIRKALGDFAASFGPAPTTIGTVASVGERTCILTVDDLDYPDIRLSPVIDGTEGLTIFPKVGTMAMAIRIEEADEWMLIGCQEIDKYRLVVGDLVFEVGTDQFTVKKGADSLKDALTLIVEAIQQIVVIYGNNPAYDKLTQALTKINNIFH
jgi:hypothetical protein